VNDLAAILTRRTLERMPTVSIAIVLAMSLSMPFGPQLGIGLSQAPLLLSGLVILAAALLGLAAYRNRIPRRLVHPAAALLWLTAPALVLIGAFETQEHMLTGSLLIGLMCAPAVQVSTPWLVGSTTLVAAAWVPIGVRDLGDRIGLGLVSVCSAVILSLVWHLIDRRGLVDAEQRRAEQADTSARLRHELAARERETLARERLREQFVHAQKMDAVGTLAAGLAHDMNNILAGVIGTAEQILPRVTDLGARADLAQLVGEAERGAALTRNLLGFSRRGQYRKQPTLLAAIVDEMVPLLARTLPKGVTFAVEHHDGAVVDGDPAQLGQALVNLCLNGADAMDGDGVLLIETRAIELDAARAHGTGIAAGRTAVLTVTDRGSGMDEAMRQRIFEPFFTTKAPTGGTGLGLAMVFGTVQAHGGAIEVDTRPGYGTTMRLLFPASTEAPRARAAPVAAPVRLAPGKVLVIDDEPVVRKVIQRSLERLGLEVIVAEGGAAGIALVTAHRDDIDLVILDMSMPEVSGPECFDRIRALAPGIQVLIASGYAKDTDAQRMLAAGAVGFLEKPFNAVALADAVRPWLGARGKPLVERTG
jgi:signal transduction histidine kinase/CheY-like chemotaxis protein